MTTELLPHIRRALKPRAAGSFANLISGICGAALVALLLTSAAARAQEVVPEVGMWDRFELSVTNTATYASPYYGVDLNVIYTRPDGSTVAFWGFYDGDTTWKARMMCDALGQWQYAASFSDGQPGRSGAFNCVPSDIPGMLTQYAPNRRWFGYTGGEPAKIRSLQVGDRFFAANWPESSRLDFVAWAKQQGYNMLSISSHMPNRMVQGRGIGWNTPVLWPLNAAEYRRMESIMDMLEDNRIMIFPFAGFFGELQSNSPSTPADQERYVRYVMARIGPYWNLLMNVAGPEMNRVSSANQLGALVQQYNVFDHPLGLHPYDDEYPAIARQTWSSLVVVQGLEQSTSNLPAFLSNMYYGLVAAYVPGKPVYAQETFWPGNTLQPDFSNPVTVRKIGWITLMSAATLNYGDMAGNSSSGFSGTMDLAQKVQSRHDIMKKVWDFFESLPFQRMNPMPALVNNGYCLAEPGREYLVYLPQGGGVNVSVTSGPYFATWINAANTSDQRDVGFVANGLGLTAPTGAEDWLLHLVHRDALSPPELTFSIGSQSITESGGTVTVTARLSRVSDQDVTVSFAADGTAIAGRDYSIGGGSITVAAGQMSASLIVTVLDNAVLDDPKSLILTLGQPINAVLGAPARFILTILDDDLPPQVEFARSSQSVAESAGSTTVTVELSKATAADVTVPILVSGDGSAVAGEDFSISDESITIPAGSTSAGLTVTVLDDEVIEEDKTLILSLGEPTNATLGARASTTLTLLDDDDDPPPEPVPQLSIEDASATEGNSGLRGLVFNVRLSAPSADTVTADFDTQNDTAIAGSDFVARSGTVSFSPGQLLSTATVDIMGDTVLESSETFGVQLRNPANATLGTARATGTILNDDSAPPPDNRPEVRFKLIESRTAEAKKKLNIVLRLSKSSRVAVTVPIQFSGSATRDSDYKTYNNVTIPAGKSEHALAVTLINDKRTEPDETIVMTLGTPINAKLGSPATHTLTITAND